MNSAKALWFFYRLRAMGPAEICWRFRNLAYSRLQRIGLFRVRRVASPKLDKDDGRWLPFDALADSREECVKIADDLLEKGMHLFSLEHLYPCIEPDWNTDPLTGIKAPLKFGKTLDYRDTAIVGDSKYLWEPSRFLQVVPIARAYSLTGDDKYLDAVKKMIRSWLKQCPYLYGPQWSSSLELAIRLINWALAWQYIGGKDSKIFKDEDGRFFKKEWLESIYRHMDFIRGWFSKGSSANNHLIGEAAGLFTACATWPYWEDCSQWRILTRDILEVEVRRQIHLDGIDAEQAVSYQQFVLDFLLVAWTSHRESFSEGYLSVVRKMISFIGAIMDSKGNVPMIGDADDGFVTGLLPYGECPYKSLLATGGILFIRKSLRARVGKEDLKTRSLLGRNPAAVKKRKAGDRAMSRCRRFRHGGYYLLGSSFNEADEIFILVDCGPLGLGSLAAHGHADALSVYLSAGGNEFLIDPGTYAYHTDRKWRDYFRGTSAHNTIRVDGEDQSVIGGNFLWRDKAEAKPLEISLGGAIESFTGMHNGYSRLSDPVTVERSISFERRNSIVKIEDRLECSSSHTVEQFWHFSEKCCLSNPSNGIVVAENGGWRMTMSFPKNSDIKIISGQEDPPLGWISRSYGAKEPCSVVVCTKEIKNSSVLRVEFLIEKIADSER
ncbi:heparinase II/III family protein [Maridesulfovibrio bastinii]|uniref:heparinase II/III family protein n=1 Tax=Maridesulfovibrio bastinii TaxID=47157 RepID=UPI00040AB1BA|nr:alginate lyase family protein [Maridesulfovibrio bastinii]